MTVVSLSIHLPPLRSLTSSNKRHLKEDACLRRSSCWGDLDGFRGLLVTAVEAYRGPRLSNLNTPRITSGIVFSTEAPAQPCTDRSHRPSRSNPTECILRPEHWALKVPPAMYECGRINPCEELDEAHPNHTSLLRPWLENEMRHANQSKRR
jgi:hypothetical protein